MKLVTATFAGPALPAPDTPGFVMTDDRQLVAEKRAEMDGSVQVVAQ